MSNFGIRIDLLKLQGAFLRNLQGKVTKRCLIIPVDDCDSIFLGEKGCYLNMTAIEMENPQFNDSHCIKGDLPKEKRETLTDEQKRALPIIGGMKPLNPKPQPTMQVTGTLGQDAFAPNEDDLPF
jgi:hypothetical protein